MDLKSRRKLLQTGVAAALFAASGLPVASHERAQGGRLRIGVADGGPRDNWAIGAGGSTFMALADQGAVFDTLTEVSEDGSLRGELAIDWTPSEDASVWTISLRDGVRFHDGSVFGSNDVVRSFAHHGAQASVAPVLLTIDQVTALSDTKVRFHLKGGNPDFPWFLSDPALIVHSEKHLSQGTLHGIGTGLYQVDVFDPGTRLLAKRVPSHFKDTRAGWFDEVELLALPEENERLDALLSGRVDAVNGLMGQSLSRLNADTRFAVRTIPDAEYIAWECGGPEGARLRSALAGVLDRPRLVAEALGELGRVAYDLPMPGAFTGYIPPRDIKLPQEIPLTLAPGLGLAGARVVSAAARQLRELGVRLRLAATDEPGAIVVRRLPVRPLADWGWSDWAALGGNSDSELSELLENARAELDPSARSVAYQVIGRRADEHASTLIPCFVSNTLAYKRNLRLSESAKHLLDLDGARIAERWWRT